MTSIRAGVLLSVLMLAGQAVLAESPMKSPPNREGSRPLGRRADDGSKPVPTVPVILDGVEYPAGKLPMIEEGRYYVLTEEGVMHAFSAPESAREFMRREIEKKYGENADGEAVTKAYPNCAWPYIYSYFNKNRFGGGSDELFMEKLPWPNIGERYTDLDFNGWNNTISYVRAACVVHYTALYSCRNFQMDSDPFFCQDPDVLFVPGGSIYTDLVPHGFNNRTSSIRFCRFNSPDYCVED